MCLVDVVLINLEKVCLACSLMWFTRLCFSMIEISSGSMALTNLSFEFGLCHLRVVVLRSPTIMSVNLPLHLALQDEMYFAKSFQKSLFSVLVAGAYKLMMSVVALWLVCIPIAMAHLLMSMILE